MEAIFARLKGARHLGLLALLALLAAAALFLGGEERTDGSLEARMARTLSQVEGAGQVRVLLNERAEAAGAFSSAQSAEAVGVVILAEGADDVRVRLALSEAAQALLGVPAASVEVLKMEGRG